MYQDFQRRAAGFSDVFCRYHTALSISFGERAERVTGELVSGNYFQALGVGPALGRVFTPETDDRVYKGHPVVVLSHAYWQERFGADPGVIGRKILVNNYPMAIVGVSARGFSGLDPARSPQIRIPIQMKPLMTPASDNLGNRRRQWVQIFARMRPGVTVQSAQASLQPLLNQILRSEAGALPATPKAMLERFLSRRVLVEPAVNGYSDLRTTYSSALIALMAMAGVVLLIACFNVGCLLIARADARKRELAMRLAIGASRWQLIRQLLLESVLLAAAGTGAGLLVAAAAVQAIVPFLPANGMLLTLQASPDSRVLGFAALTGLATVLLFGLAPARQALKVDLPDALKGGAGGEDRSSARLRKGMVTAQVAFSFLLVAGALLFAKTLGNLRRSAWGYRGIDRLVTFQVDPASSGYSMVRQKTFYREALGSVRAAPGVRSAGYAWIQVLSNVMAGWDIAVEGRNPESGTREAFINAVSPGYWRTMGIRVLAGRDFREGDIDGRPRVAIVNRRFAGEVFGGEKPVGRRIGLDTGRDARCDIEIVGVVEDAVDRGPRQGIRRQVFFPYAQLNQPVAVAFYLRTTEDAGATYAMVRRRIHELDATMPVYGVNTVEGRTGRDAEQRAPGGCACGGIGRAGHTAGGGWPVWRDGFGGGAADAGNRIAHGPGRERGHGCVDGHERGIRSGRGRTGAGCAWRVRAEPAGRVAIIRRGAGRCRERSRGGGDSGAGRGGSSVGARAARKPDRPDGGAKARVGHGLRRATYAVNRQESRTPAPLRFVGFRMARDPPERRVALPDRRGDQCHHR